MREGKEDERRGVEGMVKEERSEKKRGGRGGE